MIELLKRVYFWTVGYSYTNLGRLFLRLFVGVMMLHFGMEQYHAFDTLTATFPSVIGLSPQTGLTLLVATECICSIFIMAGLMMRIMIMPPFLAMIIAEHYLLTDYLGQAGWTIGWQQPGFLPIMFLGIYFFLLMVGPGKISCDYFLSLHIIHTDNKSESALEEV